MSGLDAFARAAARFARVATWAIFAAFGAAALAQPAGELGSDDPQNPDRLRLVKVDLGFAGKMAEDSWSPVVVWLSSGSRSISGVVTVKYRQDGTQDAEISVPFSTTPNTVVPFELAACLDGNTRELRVEVIGGRLPFYVDFERYGTSASSLLTASPPWVLLVGDETASALRDPELPLAPPRSAAPGQALPPPDAIWDAVTVDQVAPAELPTGWLSYSGVHTLVIRASTLSECDRRAVDAMAQWVDSGGRIVLQVDGAGPDWRRLVPGLGEMVRIDEPERLVPGASAAAAGQPRRRPMEIEPEPVSLGPVPARLIHVSDTALREGWTIAWPLAPGGSRQPDAQHEGLLASGPVGMGVVTLVGVEPKLLSPVLSSRATQGSWQRIVEHAAPVPSGDPDSQSFTRDFGLRQRAMIQVLDATAFAPPPSIGVIIGIGGCMVLLAVVVGPLERRRFRRGALASLSWLRAIGWIVAFSVAGLLMPRALRNGESSIGSVRVIDVLQRDAGPSPAWETAVMGVFAGKPLRWSLPEVDGAWGHGIAATRAGSTGGGFLPMRSVLSAAGADGFPREIRTDDLVMPQWTFRGALQQSPSRPLPAPRVSVQPVLDTWEVSVSDLPANVTVRRAALCVRGVWHNLQLGDTELIDGADLPRSTPEMTFTWKPAPQTEEDPNVEAAAATPKAATPNWLLATEWGSFPEVCIQLPGVRDRGVASQMRVERGYACVVLYLSDLHTPFLAPELAGDRRESVLYRIFVPLADVPGTETTP